MQAWILAFQVFDAEEDSRLDYVKEQKETERMDEGGRDNVYLSKPHGNERIKAKEQKTKHKMKCDRML